MPTQRSTKPNLRVGIIASVGSHLDNFFPEIIEEWRESGIEVFPASGTPSKILGNELLCGVTQAPSLKSIRAFKSLRKWAKRNKLDYIITNTATVSAIVRLAIRKVPIIYFCHGFHWNTGRLPMERVWQKVEIALAKRTHLLITLNSDDTKWAKDTKAYKNFLYLEGGVGVPEKWFLGREVGFDPKLPYLWIGDFSRRKRPQVLLETVEQLKETMPEITVIMAGDGPLRSDIERQIRDRDLNDQIVTLGHVDDVMSLIDSCAGVIHTSAWEGLPRVLLEATVRGRPTYGFDVKGVRDIPGVILARDANAGNLARKILEDRHRVTGTNLRLEQSSGLPMKSRDIARTIRTQGFDK